MESDSVFCSNRSQTVSCLRGLFDSCSPQLHSSIFLNFIQQNRRNKYNLKEQKPLAKSNLICNVEISLSKEVFSHPC